MEEEFRRCVDEATRRLEIKSWTSCQLYGHAYANVDGMPGWRHCEDCGDSYYDEDNVHTQ